MNKKLFALVLFPLLSVSFLIGNVNAEAPKPDIPYKDTWTTAEVKTMVDYYADKYSVSRQLMHKVVACESSYNVKAVNWNDSHKLSQGSHGVGQFSKETFIGFAKKMNKEYDDPYNPNQALDVMSWAISNGYGNHWSCFRK